MQRSHQAHGSSPVIPSDFLMRVMFAEKYDRFPPACLESRIDAIRLRAYFFEKVFVAVYFGAARRSYLHEGEAMLEGRVKIQEVFDAAETLDDSLGVVNAIYPHAQQAALYTQFARERRALFSGVSRFVYGVPIFRKRYADRIRPHPRNVSLPIDRKTVPLRQRFHGTIHRFQKIVAMRLDMEADQVRAEQAIH